MSSSLPKLGSVHVAAFAATVLTSTAYVAVFTGTYDSRPLLLLGYPLVLLMASMRDLRSLAAVSSAYIAGYLLLLYAGFDETSLILLPILTAYSRRLGAVLTTLAAALGLWLSCVGYLQLGVGVVVVSIGLYHLAGRNTAKGLASASLLYLASLLVSTASLIPVALLYALYLYVEEESRAYRPYVDRGLVVAGFAAQYFSLAPFLVEAPSDAAWIIAASASYFLAAGLMIPRPSS